MSAKVGDNKHKKRQNSVIFTNLVKVGYTLPQFLHFFILYVPVGPFITSRIVKCSLLAQRYRDASF